jgi:hypothetical protein
MKPNRIMNSGKTTSSRQRPVGSEHSRFTALASARRFGGLLVLGAWLSAAVASAAHLPLAITEIMTSAATNCMGVWTSHPDFWEITNFGTNTIDLSGFIFRDSNLPDGAQRIAEGVLIGRGESIVFVRREGNSTIDKAAFCAWWGLATCPQIQFFDGFGLSNAGEELWLWDADRNLVDHVTFGEARDNAGVTFAYDATTGRFGELSEMGVCGAWRAAQCDDIGSPGRAPCGPVPLMIRAQPASQTVDAGMDATFGVQADGLPQPVLDWYSNGVHVVSGSSSSGYFPTVVNFAGSGLAWKTAAKVTDLVLPRVTPAGAGDYYAVLDNGLQRMTTAVARLSVNTNPAPPQIVSPPIESRWPEIQGQPQTNLTVAPGQTAEFAVLVRGYPLPTHQWSWSSDGTHFSELSGATNNTLVIANAQPTNAGIYRVRVGNRWGVTNAFAGLTVKPKPRLRITEAMGWVNDPAHPNWWELTNVGDEPEPLYGYRWDDSPGNIGAGPTITNLVTIQPGESVVFCNDRSPEGFVRSWGASNLPPNLKLIPYEANGLSEFGDWIRIWNPTATKDHDFIDSVVFSTFTMDTSFWFLPDDPCSEFGIPSIVGQCGAFRAVEGGEVGSPGWTDWTPPCLTSIRREGTTVRLHWKAQPSSTNRVQYTRSLAMPSSDTAWTDLGSYSYAGATGTATDASLGSDGQRFYRLVRIAPNGCRCVE